MPYGYVYITTNTINNKIYIGQHKSDTFDKHYYGSGLLINESIKKYGIENFKCEILEWCNSFEELNEKEIYWIAKYDAMNLDIGYNLNKGGTGGDIFNQLPKERQLEYIERWKLVKEKNGTLHLAPKSVGHKHSDETKKLLSKLHKGKHHSEETKVKIGKSLKGRVVSEETKQKIGDGNRGKYVSEETKKKISKNREGKTSGNKNKIAINNGTYNKYIDASELEYFLSIGFVKGTVNKGKPTNRKTKGSTGMRWYTNGEHSVLCLPENKPENYYLKYKRKEEQ